MSNRCGWWRCVELDTIGRFAIHLGCRSILKGALFRRQSAGLRAFSLTAAQRLVARGLLDGATRVPESRGGPGRPQVGLGFLALNP
jgi:hypothetical protein